MKAATVILPEKTVMLHSDILIMRRNPEPPFHDDMPS
jgi:hypothetical protein